VGRGAKGLRGRGRHEPVTGRNYPHNPEQTSPLQGGHVNIPQQEIILAGVLDKQCYMDYIIYIYLKIYYRYTLRNILYLKK
jgi:hypothetical protein